MAVRDSLLTPLVPLALLAAMPIDERSVREGEPREIEIVASDPLLEGRGHSKRLAYEASARAVLYVWATSDSFDPFVRVESSAGELLAEDDNSVRGNAAFAKLEAAASLSLWIHVASSKSDEVGRVHVAIFEVPRLSPERYEELERASHLADDSVTLLELGQPDAARASVSRSIQALLALRAEDDCRRLPQEVLEALVAASTTASNQGELLGARLAQECVHEALSRSLPPDHPELSHARRGLAITLCELGEFTAGRERFAQLLDTCLRTLPADHPTLQQARLNLAAAIYAQRDFAAARALQEQVLEVRARTLPDDDVQLQYARGNMAGTLYAQGDLAGARALQEKVLEVFARMLPEDHPDLQRARGNLAGTLHAQGDLARARALQIEVIEALKRALPAEHPELQGARVNLASTLEAQGDLAGARQLEEEALRVGYRLWPEDHPELSRIRVNLARTAHAQGDLAVARALLERAIESCSRTLPEDHVDLQMAYGGLAGTLYAVGDFAGARSLEERVLEVMSRTLPEDHPDLQRARLNLALLLKAQGDLAGARALEEHALAVNERTLSEDHLKVQSARMNLAATLYEHGDLRAACQLQDDVVESFSRTLPEDHPQLQRARLQLAITKRAQGETASAQALQEGVLRVLARTLPSGHPDLMRAQRELAFTLAVGHATDARAEAGAQRESRDAARSEFASIARNYTQGVTHLAREAIVSASIREAEERCGLVQAELSNALSFAQGLEVFEPDTELDQAAFVLSEISRGVARTSAALARRGLEDSRHAELRSKTQTASAELARAARAGGPPDEIDRARSARESAERELLKLAHELPGSARDALEFDLDRLRSRIGSTDALVAYRRYTRSACGLGTKAALTSTESLCAFVVRRDSPLVRIELGPIDAIEAGIDRWRAVIGATGGDARGLPPGSTALRGAPSDQAGEQLRELVVDPLVEALEGVQRVILALDDVLHLLPLDALPLREKPAVDGPLLLGDRWQIETRNTLVELLMEEPRPERGGALVLLGNPAYDAVAASVDERQLGRQHGDASDVDAQVLTADVPARTRATASAGVLRGGTWEAGFAPLNGASAEVRAIADLFAHARGHAADSHQLELARASRANLFALAPEARYLHIATHGWFAPDSIRSWTDPDPVDPQIGVLRRISGEDRIQGMSPMLLCGLALAGANLSVNELGQIPGLVTAEEISTLDLSTCELAVLSACDTNVGQRRAGQGVASLQKALHIAGARTVVTSLWRVPDEATKVLMVEFYRRIWVEQEPKSQALWAAKRKLREARDERNRPVYTLRDWAAWVLTGDSR